MGSEGNGVKEGYGGGAILLPHSPRAHYHFSLLFFFSCCLCFFPSTSNSSLSFSLSFYGFVVLICFFKPYCYFSLLLPIIFSSSFHQSFSLLFSLNSLSQFLFLYFSYFFPFLLFLPLLCHHYHPILSSPIRSAPFPTVLSERFAEFYFTFFKKVKERTATIKLNTHPLNHIAISIHLHTHAHWHCPQKGM